MKYLKSFESVNTNFYEEISIPEADRFIYNNHIFFEENIIDKLLDIFIENNIDKDNISLEVENKGGYVRMTVFILSMEFIFHSLNDEWFVLLYEGDIPRLFNTGNTFVSRVFKCDQLEGLVNCLKDQILFIKG